MRSRTRLAAVAALAALAVPATAEAAESTRLPTQAVALTSAQAVARDCTDRLLAARAAGVTRHRYEAPVEGAVTFRIAGGRRAGDWDLALFDASGRKLAASANGAATEVVSAWTHAGDRLTLQACRRSGSARSVRLTVAPVAAELPRDEVSRLIRVATGGNRDVPNALEDLGLDVTHHRTADSVDVIVHGAGQLQLLEQTGLGLTTRIANLDRAYVESRSADARQSGSASNLPTGRTEYRTYEDYGNELKALAEQNPKLVKRIELPQKTIQGRTVEGVEIGRDVQASEDGRPVFLLVGIHHAREWPSAETAMEFAHMLVKGYGSDERLTRIVDNSRVIVVPIINPDGFVSSRTASFNPDADPEYTAAAASGTGGYRRKNCAGPGATGSEPCENVPGVDPNRNYGAGWGTIGAASTPESQTYRGEGPFSEFETQNLQALGHQRQIVTMITLHNVAALVLRPPSRESDGLAPDEARLKALGDAMGKATGYVSQYGWQLYDTSGTTEDWFYAALGTFGYTIEIGPHNGFFHEPYEDGVIKEWNGEGTRDEANGHVPNPGQGMRVALLLAAENALDTTDHSVIAGVAPPGRVLHITKAFKTATARVCTAVVSPPVSFVNPPLSEATEGRCAGETDPILFDDKVDTKMTVPASGEFVYHVNPSTRPFEAQAGRTESFKLTCEDAAGKVLDTRDVVVARGQRVELGAVCGGRPPCGAAKAKLGRIKLTGRSVRVAGRSKCAVPVRVAIARQAKGKCRFLQASGRLGKARPCSKPVYLKAKGKRRFTLVRKAKLPRGRYLVLGKAGKSKPVRKRVRRR
jgi:hypothetical protein